MIPGVMLPQVRCASSTALRDFGNLVSAAGFEYIAVVHHDLGVVKPTAETLSDWPLPVDDTFQPYTVDDPFHEPFVVMGFLAAATSLALTTNILVLPQRNTIAVAKHAAELQLLTNGKFTLAVGVGWNRAEIAAMGVDPAIRAPRYEEQISLLRSLWSHRTIDFAGRWHSVRGLGISPRPLWPIPIWMGSGTAAAALDRVGRLADGWLPMVLPGPELHAGMNRVRRAAEAAGRDPSAIGLRGVIRIRGHDVGRLAKQARRWLAAGATHLTLDISRLTAPAIGTELGVLEHAVKAIRSAEL